MRARARTPTFTALLLVALLGLAGCGRPRTAERASVPGDGPALAATVTHVVDGDTFDVELAGTTERVRLLGIDTPETVKPDHPVDCYGPEASARTKALLPAGTRVLLQRDQEARDRYGRLLVYAWLADGTFVNGSLVRDGYADTLSIEPNTAHRADLSALRAEAKGARRGLWGSCPDDG